MKRNNLSKKLFFIVITFTLSALYFSCSGMVQHDTPPDYQTIFEPGEGDDQPIQTTDECPTVTNTGCVLPPPPPEPTKVPPPPPAKRCKALDYMPDGIDQVITLWMPHFLTSDLFKNLHKMPTFTFVEDYKSLKYGLDDNLSIPNIDEDCQLTGYVCLPKADNTINEIRDHFIERMKKTFSNEILPMINEMPNAIKANTECIAYGAVKEPTTSINKCDLDIDQNLYALITGCMDQIHGETTKIVAIAYGNWTPEAVEEVRVWANKSKKKEVCQPQTAPPNCPKCLEDSNMFNSDTVTDAITSGTDIILFENADPNYPYDFGALGSKAIFVSSLELSEQVMKIYKGENEKTVEDTPRLWAVFSNLPDDSIKMAVLSKDPKPADINSAITELESWTDYEDYVEPFINLVNLLKGHSHLDLGFSIRVAPDFSGYAYQFTTTDDPSAVSIAGSSYLSRAISDEIHLIDLLISMGIRNSYEMALAQYEINLSNGTPEGEALIKVLEDSPVLPLCNELPAGP